MKKGFTLVELIVVIAMIMILAGAVGSGVMSAQRNAKIAKASAEVRELTNALLAYENYVSGSNDKGTFRAMNGDEATEGALAFLLGKGGTSADGRPVPVLFNGHFTGGKMIDPWGNAYRVLIKPGSATIQIDSYGGFKTVTFMPNYYRLGGDEEDVN